MDEAKEAAAAGPFGCAWAVTSGMLMRWFYEKEPGGGFTHAGLTEHIKNCAVCEAEVREITEEDEELQARFQAVMKADEAMLEAIRERTVLEEVGKQIEAAVEKNAGDAAQESIDLILVLRAEDSGEKVKALLRALEERRAEPEPGIRLGKLRKLSEFTKGTFKVETAQLASAMAQVSDESKSYPVDDPATLGLVVQVLSHPESHASSGPPILRLRDNLVIVDWAAWRLAAKPANVI
jgi:hypothetical protein